MTRIDDLLAAGPTTSFEFFPPRTPAGDHNLREALAALEPLHPSFVSVTYGAGGSTRERTHQLVIDLLERTSMPPMAHLTRFGHTRAELVEILTRYRDAGVENILALRGDAPRDHPEADPGELQYAIRPPARRRRRPCRGPPHRRRRGHRAVPAAARGRRPRAR